MGKRLHPATSAAACAMLLGIFLALSWTQAHRQSATADEPLHALAAYRNVFEGDFRIDPENPPLWKYLLMLPHHPGELKTTPRLDELRAQTNDGFIIATKQLFQTPGNDGQAFVNRSRTIMVIVGVLLGAAVAIWSWQIAGATAAVVACALYALDPNFVAHAALVKNDVAMVLAIVGLAWATWRVGRAGTWTNLALLLPICGVATTIKTSGPAVGIMLAGMLVIRAMMNQPWSVLGRELNRRSARIGAAFLICLASAVIAWLMIWACYRFRFDPAPGRSPPLHMQESVDFLKRNAHIAQYGTELDDNDLDKQPVPPMASVLIWLDDHHLFPHALLCGLMQVYASTAMHPAYLMGEFSATGWWYYFPLVMLFKTPLAILAAFVGAPIISVAMRRAGQSRDDNRWTHICLLVPCAVYAAAALGRGFNLGIRHILPLYPFIYILIAMQATRLRQYSPKAFAISAVIIGAGLAIEAVSALPHHLSFFNVLARPARLDLLADSNLDWGQDLTYVARWQAEHPQTKLYLGYWGPTDPWFYGIKYTNLPGGFALGHDPQPLDMTSPGVVMVSATMLQGVNVSPDVRDYYAFLRGRAPDQIIGDTIYLYNWRLK